MIHELSPETRALPARHYIDPGFVNNRLVETVVRQEGIDEIHRMLASQPVLPEWKQKTSIAHVYTRVALAFCEAIKVPALGEVLAQGQGSIFCSTEQVIGNDRVFSDDRIILQIVVPGCDHPVALDLGTEHIVSSTMKSLIENGETISIIAAMPEDREGVLTFRPLIMGSPWLEIDDERWTDTLFWLGREFFENRVEDFDEFSKVLDVATPTAADARVMEEIRESAFKTCLAEILGDNTQKDWGGESSDHFTAHLHLRGRRVSAAFLLKGPARYAPMTLNHLGKNNDQIYRLSQEPAEVLFVQHCHDILPPVRATLRAFAVQPSRSRRYCLMDGRDSFRLLTAYEKVDRALDLSTNAA